MPLHTTRTGVVDRIEHEDRSNLTVPVVILLMSDEKIELYGVSRGLEEYAGVLQSMYSGGQKRLATGALASIMTAIKRRVEQDPCSCASYYWLRALYPSGLLGYAEGRLRGG